MPLLYVPVKITFSLKFNAAISVVSRWKFGTGKTLERLKPVVHSLVNG
jgi:hypothetical protein